MNNPDHVETVFNLVCRFFNQDPKEVKSKSRKHELVEVRFWFYWLARTYYKGRNTISYSVLGAYLRRDHSSALHGINKVKEWMDIDKKAVETSRQLLYEMEEISGDVAYRSDIAAGKYTDAVKKQFSEFRDTLLILRNHVLNDANSEGWRKEKKMQLIRNMDSKLKDIENFPLMYDQVKKNIQNDLYEA